MDYFKALFSRAFWDTWDLVFNRSFASAMVGVAIFASTLIYLRCRKRHQDLKHQLKDFGVAGLFTGGAFGALFLLHFFVLTPKNLVEESRVLRDLRMSVIRYRYSGETHELISDVQFVNNGGTRRTVLGAVFTYRADNETHMAVSSVEEFHGNQPPVYVESGQPIVATYRHKLDDENLTRTLGVVFGLELTTIRPDGGMNYTSVEAMAVTGFPGDPKVRGLLTSPQRNISMDIPGGHTSIEVPVMPPSPTPGKEASPPKASLM